MRVRERCDEKVRGKKGGRTGYEISKRVGQSWLWNYYMVTMPRRSCPNTEVSWLLVRGRGAHFLEWARGKGHLSSSWPRLRPLSLRAVPTLPKAGPPIN